MRFVSEENGKSAKIKYPSLSPAAFLIRIRLLSRSMSSILSDSANFTRATSSGDDA